MFKKIKKIILFIAIVFASILIFQNKANASSDLFLNELNFDVKINSTGDMKVTETWNIDIEDTNTLFKTFKLDEEKYTSINDVEVKDITSGKEFTQIYEEMYHVTKDCYYALKNSNGDFEIAWGVGLDSSKDTRIYEISYVVKDAIGKYNDYSELYWQFIGEDFEIDAEKITGKIILPENASSKENIKVWGHTEGLNGEIYVTNENEISFQIENYNSGRYVEVRTLFPTNMITNANRTYNEERYNQVVEEETKWVEEANARRKAEETREKIIFAIYIIVITLLCILFIFKAIKYGKKLKKLKKYKPEQELEYFRELPEKDVTPGEAIYILEEPYNKFSIYFGKIFSASILNLKLKNYIDLRVEKNEKGKDKIYIKRLKQEDEKLKSDESEILKFIYKAKPAKDEIEIKELEKYITSHSTSVEKLIKENEKLIETQLEKSDILNKTEKKEYINYSVLSGLYFVFIFITLVLAFPLSIILLINAILCYKIMKRINVLTQKGIDNKEKWKGLKKYMEDFSLLNEKEIPAIQIWEKYLVYATVFGIAEKVLKQLKTVYPNIDELDVSTSAYMYFMYHSNFSSSFTNSINSSISSAYSSATGGGGGFSGGGGGGRWPEVVEEEDNSFPKIKL